MPRGQFDIDGPITARLAPVLRTDSPGAGAAPVTCPGPLTHVRHGTSGLERSPDLAAALGRSSGGRLARVGSSLLQLQRQYGNRYVQGIIRRAQGNEGGPPSGSGGAHQLTAQPATAVPVIQAKLMVGAPGDRYEREADRVARRLGVQRPGGNGWSREAAMGRADPESEAEPMTGPPAASHGGARNRAWPELEASVSRARGGGQSLAPPVLKPMEQAFGADFGQVRVHQDPESDELCRTMAARAFTVGDQIFVRNSEHVGQGSPGRHLLAHELTHVVQQRGASEAHGTMQAFWVRDGGGYRWVRDQAKKQRYIRTAQTRSTFKRPLKRAVYVDPWAPGTQLRVDPQLGFTPEEQSEFETSVVDDLKLIRRTDVGAKLLQMLATQVPGRTTIQPQAGIRGPVTQTERTRTGMSSTVILTPGQLDAAMELAAQGIKIRETPWNPSPSDVVLFHELLHAYHNLNGTRATGQVTEEQALHPGDAGELMSEYQVVGLSTQDGDENHQYGFEYYTENTYRAQTHRPHRDTYTPRRKTVKKKKK